MYAGWEEEKEEEEHKEEEETLPMSYITVIHSTNNSATVTAGQDHAVSTANVKHGASLG